MKKVLSKVVVLALTVCMIFVCVLSASAAVSMKDFSLLKGGTKPETQKVQQTEAGIEIKGQGSYSGTDQAAGVIYTKAVDPKDVTVEYTVNSIPTLNPLIGGQWSQERDSWYTVSLMDQPKYWTNLNTQVKSISIAISPIKDNKAYVHAFSTFGEGFGQHSWLATIPCKLGDTMKVNIKWVNKKITASINGTNIPLPDANETLSNIAPVMQDKGYVAVSCNTGKNEAAMTLKKINNVLMGAEKATTASTKASTASQKVTTVPKTEQKVTTVEGETSTTAAGSTNITDQAETTGSQGAASEATTQVTSTSQTEKPVSNNNGTGNTVWLFVVGGIVLVAAAGITGFVLYKKKTKS